MSSVGLLMAKPSYHARSTLEWYSCGLLRSHAISSNVDHPCDERLWADTHQAPDALPRATADRRQSIRTASTNGLGR